MRRRGVLDPIGEGRDHCVLDRRETALEEERAQRSLEQGGGGVAVLREPLELLRLQPLVPLREPRAEVALTRHDSATRARYDMRTDLGEPALGELGIAAVELVRSRELEHAVAEELEAFVRERALRRRRRVPGRNVRE